MLRNIGIAAALCCPLTNAAAEVTVFNNYRFDDKHEPFEFPWLKRNELTPSGLEQWLDITQAPSAETGAPSLLSLLYSYTYPATSSSFASERIRSSRGPSNTLTPQAFIARGPDVTLTSPRFGTTVTVTPPLELLPGQTVGPLLTYATNPDAFPQTYFRWISGQISEPLLQGQTFVGVQLTLPTGTHYGWIELLRTNFGADDQWRPMRWAYETTPDTPLTIPHFLGTPCPADVDGDGFVGSSDLAALLGSWGADGPTDLAAPFGVTDSVDLAFMLGSWGPCP